MKILKEVRIKAYLRYIRRKMRIKNGIGGFLRRNQVLINQAEWNKEKQLGRRMKKLRRLTRKLRRL